MVTFNIAVGLALDSSLARVRFMNDSGRLTTPALADAKRDFLLRGSRGIFLHVEPPRKVFDRAPGCLRNAGALS